MSSSRARTPRRPGLRASIRAAVTLASLGAALAAPAGAQQATVDEGTFVITRGGAAAGRESFRIVQAADQGRVLTATAQIAYGDRRIAPTLSADGRGTALLYRVEVRSGGQLQERLQASARPGRLSAVTQTPRGEASKEYVVGTGAVVLDDEVFHQYGLLPLARRDGALTVVVPRTGAQHAARLVERGAESVTVDGREVAATRWELALPDDARSFWVDARGRLLKVALPAQGVMAVRDEVPR